MRKAKDGHLRGVDEEDGLEDGAQVGGKVGLQLVGHARDADEQSVDQVLAALEAAADLVARRDLGRLQRQRDLLLLVVAVVVAVVVVVVVAFVVVDVVLLVDVLISAVVRSATRRRRRRG